MTETLRLDGAMQENVLTLLCFSDDYCKLVRAAVKPSLFESAIFRDVAAHACDFVDQYGEAIKDHLPDHLEDVLKADDRKAHAYKQLLENLYQSKETVNAQYVLNQLHRFVRLQGLKSTMITAFEALEDGRVDEAERAMQEGLSAQVVAFEPGLDLSSDDALEAVLDAPEPEGFELGIAPLDNEGIIPRRKELFMFLAARGKGKSWFAAHAAKMAVRQRWSVLIVTLEMSEQRYGARMLQSFFSLTRRVGSAILPRLVLDKGGSLVDVTKEEVDRLALMNPDDRGRIRTKVRAGLGKRAKLKIKEFPTGVLTLAMLEAYLDGLERFEKFVPDVVIIDYPDLMQIDPKNYRMEIGNITAKLRGIAVKRNLAMVALSQGNRESETATTVTGSMAAEDISKLATADVMVTYSQTPAELKLGLARILAEKARNEASKFQVLITQAYAVGQFCLDAMLLDADYWDMIGRNEENPGRRKRRRDDDDEE